MAINVGDILASFRVIDEATAPLESIAGAQADVASTLTRLTQTYASASGPIEQFNAQIEGFTGMPLAAKANDLAAAIEAVGGVTRLTAAEQASANTVIEAALAKYEALGIEAPAGIRDLATALQESAAASALAAEKAEDAKTGLSGIVNVLAALGDKTATLAEQRDAVAFLSDSYAKAQGTVAEFKTLVTDLTGLPLAARANDMAMAVEAIGGASRLTASEQARVNAVMEEALAKYEALGIEAPQAIRDLAAATNQAATATETLGTESTLTERGVALLATGVKAATVALTAMIAGATAAGVAIMKIGEHGAGVGDITEQFDKFATKAGMETPAALAKLRTATAGTLSDFDLMKASLPLLSSGFKGSAEELGTMAEAARVLSERGIPLEQALNMVTTAMTTGRTRALSLQGVVIDMQGSLKNLKDATQEEGSAVETSASLHVKQQEILKGLKGLVQANGEVMLDFADRTDQARVRFANFYNELAKRISESAGLNSIIDRIGGAIVGAFGANQEEAIANIVGAIDRASVVVADFGVKVVEWLRGILPTVERVARVLWDVLVVAWWGVDAVIQVVAGTIRGVKTWFESLPQWAKDAALGVGILTAAIWLLNTALVAVSGPAIVGLLASLGRIVVAVQATAMSIVGGGGLIASLGLTMSTLGGVAVAIASVTAALYAGKIAWDIYKNAQQAQEDSANSVATAWRQMDEASAIVGYAVRSQADALVILGARAEELRAQVGTGSAAWVAQAQAAKSANDALGIISGTGLPAVSTAAKAMAGAVTLSEEALKKLADAEKAMSGQAIIDETNEMVATYGRLAKQGIQSTIEAEKKLHEQIKKALAVYARWGKEAPTDLGRVQAATEGLLTSTDIVVSQLGKFPSAARTTTGLYEEAIYGVIRATDTLEDEFMVELPAATRTYTDALGVVVDAQNGVWEDGQLIGFLNEAGDGFRRLGADATTAGERIETGFLAIVAGIPDVVVSALTGGGGLSGAFKAIGSQIGALFGTELGKSLVSSIGGMLGKTLGAIMPGIGATLGPVLGWISDKFLKTEGKKVNDIRDAYVAAAGGIDALNRSAVAAGTTLDALLRAKTVKDYEAAIASLNTRLESTAKLQGELAELQGVLADRSVMNWQRAEELAIRYGGTLASLGTQFEAAKLHDSFVTIWDDFQTLIDMGADAGATFNLMSEEIAGALTEAIRLGAEVPEQFRPFVQTLIEQGRLLDANGQAIKDIGAVTFGASLVSDTDKIIAAIKELIEVLKTGLGPAIANIPSRVDVNVGYRYEDYVPPEEGGFTGLTFAGGTHGQYPDFGAGTTVTLHGRERVMTEAEGRSEGGLGSDAIVAELQGLRRDQAMMDVMLRRAVRDAVLTAGG